ncbi:MAG: N-acetylmuramoyl-L-alanine amidase [Firmicutes bacterium]|nr:N-acetylmuramoyl-L-alanine amidase [Bacillota bacterium]
MIYPYRIEQWKKRFRPFGVVIKCILFLLILLIIFLLASNRMTPEKRLQILRETQVPEWINVQLIDVDGASRRGEELQDVQDIVIHYVANPGATAQNNRDFFNSAASNVSSHFVIGLDGEIIQCIPLNEKCSASNWRNLDSISIEVCHPDESGQFNDASYQSLVRLTAWLCDLCGLKNDHIIRHYDITGKMCPLYYVEHPEAWEQFRRDVKSTRGFF